MKPDSNNKPWHVEKDQSGLEFGTGLWTAGVLLVLLILQSIYLPFGWEFDINSPDFNPAIVVPLLLIGAILWSLLKAARHWWHLRRFGETVMELHGRAPAAPGGACRGLVRTKLPLNASGDYQITLRCIESYLFRKPGAGVSTAHERYQHVTAWEQTLTIPPAGTDSSRGLPFEFQLPKVRPLAQYIQPTGNQPYFRFKASINIPGLKKRVITHNELPSNRAWWLEVTAPTHEGSFRAQFQVPALSESR